MIDYGHRAWSSMASYAQVYLNMAYVPISLDYGLEWLSIAK